MTIGARVVDPELGTIRRVYKDGTIGRINEGPVGYLRVRWNGEVKLAHRVIWEYVNGPVPTGMEIDHINGIKSDNRIVNLRLTTRSENMQNRQRHQSNSFTGVKGVSPRPNGKWWAAIGVSGRVFHLGSFRTIEEAEAAYKGAAAILHTHNPSAQKEGPAEAIPKGVQPPEEKQPPGNTGA